jgi:hypothetical protein
MELNSISVYIHHTESYGNKTLYTVHVDPKLGMKCTCDAFVYRKQWMVCPHMLYVREFCQGAAIGRITNQLLVNPTVKQENKTAQP